MGQHLKISGLCDVALLIINIWLKEVRQLNNKYTI